MYAVIVYEDSLHLEIRLLAVLLVFELNEGVLKTILSSFISNNFAGYDFAKATEDQIQILIYEAVSYGSSLVMTSEYD